MSYKDVRGEQAIPFYEAFGFAGSYNGTLLAEIYEMGDGISISAHAEAEHFTVSFKPGGTSLIHTDKDTQTTVKIGSDGLVSASKRVFDYVRGPVGPVTPAYEDNRFSEARVQEIATAAYRAAKPFLAPQQS